MNKRPKPGEDEEDILRMQEEYLKEKAKNENFQPAAQVTCLRRAEPIKRASTSENEAGFRKPSKYAQSRGPQNFKKRARSECGSSASVVGDILEKNVDDLPRTIAVVDDDDNVYYPKVIPALLGDIVERNTDSFVDFSVPMPSKGFPAVTRRDPSIMSGQESIHGMELQKSNDEVAMSMDIDIPSCSNTEQQHSVQCVNLPDKSFILSSVEANEIHKENVSILCKLSENEILEEQQKLLSSLDPKLVQFLKAKRKKASHNPNPETNVQNISNVEEKMETSKAASEDLTSICTEPSGEDTLWENDVLFHPHVGKWLHFDTFEKDKLDWMKGLEDRKRVKPDEPYEARFDFKGYLLPYTIEYTENSKTLFHHGDEPHRPGYSLTELFELSRSSVIQQRAMALNTIAGVLEHYTAGIYKDIIEIPLSKIFFVIRIGMDENKAILLEPALKAMRNLFYNRIDEASLDALLGFKEGSQQPCLENDKSEIEELESKESELKDFHLAEIDLIAAALRTDIIQRLYYILEKLKPSFNCVQYSLQILIRLTRDSVETATRIMEADHLLHAVVKNFVPSTGLNFAFDPQIVYSRKPVLAALKLLRILSLQSKELADKLVSTYDILKPISEYISSGVDGTYGLRVQIEAYCILSNLMHYNVGIENAVALFPIIVTSLYKHVQGTDVFINSSIISATHAAIVLQFMNKLLNCSVINLENFKQQIYPLLKDGVQKWTAQLSSSDSYTCGHLRLICAILDCCKTMVLAEKLQMKFLYESLKLLSLSRGFKEIINNLIPSSNLLSKINSKDLHLSKNLMSLQGSVIDAELKVLPLLNVASPLPFLASLFTLLTVVDDKELTHIFIENTLEYFRKLSSQVPNLCDNWFTRTETDFVFAAVTLSIQYDLPEAKKDLLYGVANKLCYILRIDKNHELQCLFNNVIFSKQWFTAERLLNLVSLSDADGFSKTLSSIRLCYTRVLNFNYKYTGPNVVLREWQQPVLPRDWIYLPILTLYSKSQEIDTTHKVIGDHANRVAIQIAVEKELIINCCLEWILFNEVCFPDILNDIDTTDRFCRIMCLFLCDNSLFLNVRIKHLLHKCIQILFKKKEAFNFDRPLTGLHNFQDFYTQLLEQFQSVSYGDHTFAACVLVPLAQQHNVKWRKLLWSEYAGCLRALDCPEELLCYEIVDYLYPEETDESLLKSYIQAMLGNLLRPNTITYRIAKHHLDAYKKRLDKS